MEFLQSIRRPGREYTPIPFWFLNGDLTHREIRRQLRDFRDHGVYGVVLHPRMGLGKSIQYLSPLFFRYMRTAVETAAELGMKTVLYDEGMYPSGSAGGLIVRSNPDLASRGLALQDRPLPGDRALCQTARGTLVERFSGGTIRGLHYGEDDGEENAPPSADILNPEAVEQFISLTHEAYYRELGAYFGSVILGIFTDEPSVLGRNTRDMFPWSKDFDRVFRAGGGSLEGLAALFTGEENRDTALYRRLIQEREQEVYYSPLSMWCQNHGVWLMGHPHQSDDIEAQRFFHVPGQDLVFRWVSPEKGGTEGMDSVMAKCGADMAGWMGRRRNSNECFGACNRDGNPWHFTGSDMKWYIDYLGVRGVNLFIPHAFYYSLKGRRSAERPPDVGPGNIWWPHYRQWADYMARLSCLMAEGEIQCSVAVPCRDRALRHAEVKALFESRRGFRYIPESLWPECREENGALICRGKVFRAALGMEEWFPGVSRDIASLPPDCACAPEQKDLRAARLRFHERDMWFLANEGSETIRTKITFPSRALLGGYDLWNDRLLRLKGADGQTDLTLLPNESILIFACLSKAEWEALPTEAAPALTLTNADFALVQDNPAQSCKEYAASVPGCSGDLLVRLNAQEMAELFLNGQCLGAAFWPPQVIRVPKEKLPEGPFSLRLIVTGSKANQYGVQPVAYGLDA